MTTFRDLRSAMSTIILNAAKRDELTGQMYMDDVTEVKEVIQILMKMDRFTGT
jgi:hypothetical protein